MVRIVLNYKKSLEENASDYFDKSKKAKKKLEGAKKAIEETKKKLSLLEKEGQQKEEKRQLQTQKVLRKTAWYEKFRWFFSSEGFLCIGGKDATTNEIIVKKHVEKNDVVLHTDMAGSPFVIIKVEDENKRPTEVTLQEAADFVFAHCRAWKQGIASIEVFWVNPEQVSKEANQGEYLPKGAFMIRGKTNYISPRPNYAVGEYQGAMMGGPVSAIKTHCPVFIEVMQGDEKPSDVAKSIQKKIGGTVDEIIRVLPIGAKIKKVK